MQTIVAMSSKVVSASIIVLTVYVVAAVDIVVVAVAISLYPAVVAINDRVEENPSHYGAAVAVVRLPSYEHWAFSHGGS